MCVRIVAPKKDDRDLLRAAQQNDVAAKDELIRRYRPTVEAIASEYWGPPRDDLISAGYVGLLEAIRRFDLTRNTSLRAYAASWIKKGIRDLVKDWRKGGQSGETRADRKQPRTIWHCHYNEHIATDIDTKTRPVRSGHGPSLFQLPPESVGDTGQIFGTAAASEM